MARVKRFVLCTFFLLVSVAVVSAGTYTLNDGQTVSGDPVSYDKSGVVLKTGSTFAPRTPWTQFTQESLKALAAEAKRPQDRSHIEPYLEEVIIEQERKKTITVTLPPRVELPKKTGLGAMFRSPLGLLLFVLLYGANIYAAYEISFFRYRKPAIACVVAAVLPIIGPLIFLAMPPPTVNAAAEHAPVAETVAAVEEPVTQEHYAPVQETAPAETAPALPEVITYKRGEVIFNRRFFETKMPGFLKTIPTETDKDLVLYVNSARGEKLARRIGKVTQTELYLLTFVGEATAEEMVPYTEIYEIQIRHKDMA